MYMGDLKVIDVSKKINMKVIRPYFNKLTIDPYDKSGSRKKHILWYNKDCKKIDKNTLYQSKDINKEYGGIVREYPYIQLDSSILDPILEIFIENHKDMEFNEILLQFQRIITTSEKPTMLDWHRDDVLKQAIICINRYNISGAMNEFQDRYGNISKIKLLPGRFAIFNDAEILHKVSKTECVNKNLIGIRDVILLSST